MVGPWGCGGSAQIVKATNEGQNKISKLAFRSPLVALKMEIISIDVSNDSCVRGLN